MHPDHSKARKTTLQEPLPARKDASKLRVAVLATQDRVTVMLKLCCCLLGPLDYA